MNSIHRVRPPLKELHKATSRLKVRSVKISTASSPFLVQVALGGSWVPQVSPGDQVSPKLPPTP